MLLHSGMMRLASGARRYLCLTTLLGLAGAGTAVWRGFLAAALVHDVFTGRTEALVPRLVLFLCLVAAGALLSWLRRAGELLTAAAVKRALRPRLFTHLAALGPGYVHRHGSGKIQAVLVDGVEALEGYFGAYVPQVLVSLAVPVLVLAALFSRDPFVGGAVVVAVLAALLLPRCWDGLLGRYGQAHWEAYAHLNARFVDSMQGMATLVAFNAAPRRGRMLAQDAHRLYRDTMRQLGVSLLNTGLVGLAMKGGSAAALTIAVLRLSQGALSLADLLVVLFLVGECLRPLADLDRAWHTGYQGVAAARGIFDILQATPSVVPVDGGPAVCPTGDIVCDNVTFAYDPARGPVLDGLSLTLRAGRTTALVGPSGAGKSTVAALLLRFVEGTGSITLGHTPLRDIHPDVLRRHIALVSQDTYLFYGTVADNLRLAKPDADAAALEAAARAAAAHTFIQALPQGYDTLIGERGTKLSGGERQRLSLARALLKNAPILILDEATASVDTAHEAEIQAALARATHARTTLIIAHRRNTVREADHIYVLDRGRVVASGRHADLYGRNGRYRTLLAAGAAS